MIWSMSTGVYDLGLYLHLARASEVRRQLLVRDRFLVIVAALAVEQELPLIAAHCREKILEHNPGHLLRHWPSVPAAIEDDLFTTYLKQMRRRYPREKAEQMLASLGLEMARERDTYYSDFEYAAALLGSTPEELTAKFGVSAGGEAAG